MCCVKRLLDLLTLLYTLQKCPIQPLPLLVQDALNEIARQRSKDLFKPLRVHFIGEDGIDAGGVKKEFFQLLMTELLSPDYGMLVFQPVSPPAQEQPAGSGSMQKCALYGGGMIPKIVSFELRYSFARHLINQRECSYRLLCTRPSEKALPLLQHIGQAGHS